MREKVSAPITSARREACPSRISAVGAAPARRRSRRRPPARRRRSRRACRSRVCTLTAVAGKVWSGVAVASTISGRCRRRSSPASASARAGGGDGEVGGQLAVGARSGAARCRCAADPFVGGVERRGELGVLDDPLRAGSGRSRRRPRAARSCRRGPALRRRARRSAGPRAIRAASLLGEAVLGEVKASRSRWRSRWRRRSRGDLIDRAVRARGTPPPLERRGSMRSLQPLQRGAARRARRCGDSEL